MDIKRTQNSPNFEQIKLSRNESIKVNKLVGQYRKTKSSDIFVELTDVFTPHIEKEGELKSKPKNRKDFMQDMYLNLIEIFTDPKINVHPAYSIIEKLNNLSDRLSKPSKVLKKSLERLSEKEHQLLACEQPLNEPETPKELVDRLISTTQIREREKNFINKTLNEDTYEEIGYHFGLTKESVRQVIDKGIHKIKMRHNPEYRREYERLHPNG